jgi:hypothetical protein
MQCPRDASSRGRYVLGTHHPIFSRDAKFGDAKFRDAKLEKIVLIREMGVVLTLGRITRD